MKWLIFLTLFACTTHKSGEVTPTEKTTTQGSATESDAKPISPLTVEPCVCMKIFQPVCAGGIDYGNSCEAECNGHKKWTDGNCKK
ncbi:MAG: hypothetical protein H0V66_12170 [Bdellovibrionales bacterium]|nr:hypothetical protein [Bdellovibrionales bacterium]